MMRAITASLLTLALAGCIGDPGGMPAADARPRGEGSVVVALVDSGINPYHEAFRTTEELPPPVMAAQPTPVALRFLGSWEESVSADGSFWSNIELGRLYWFQGTRVLGIALSDPTLEQPLLDHAFRGHGTGTSHAVLMRDPGAWIVMVEIGSRQTDTFPFFDPAFTVSGIRWAVEQSWIDVVSISLGAPAGAPIEGFESIPGLTLAAWEQGKVIVAATGNDATPSVTDEIAGPPWVVKAGGVVPEQHGETVLASKTPDFVGDYILQAACPQSMDEQCDYLGTSFSAPIVAGSFARAVRETRQVAGHAGGIVDGALVDAGGARVTNALLRESFNRTAVYWNATDFRPAVPPAPSDVFTLAESPFRVAQPVGPTPWTQMGWGYVEPGLGSRVAAAVLSGAPLPAKPPAAVAHMEAVDQARWAYWDR